MRRLAILLLACAAALAAPAAAHARTPVIVDTDMDFDDTAAVSYLSAADRLGIVDLRAVTVDIAGVALTGNGLAHARCELRRLGMPVPATDGDQDGVNDFPAFARPLIDGVVAEAVAPCPATTRTEGVAAELLAAEILLSPQPVTVITIGSLTNLAEALKRYPLIALKIARVYIGGGDLSATSAEPDYNIFFNPAAANAVVKALSGRVWMDSGSATDDVPITSAFRARLDADNHTAASGIVDTIANHPLVRSSEDGGGGFWWDPLTVVAATTPGVVSYQPLRISFSDAGTTVVDPHGARVQFATGANQTAFETRFLDVLNGRAPH